MDPKHLKHQKICVKWREAPQIFENSLFKIGTYGFILGPMVFWRKKLGPMVLGTYGSKIAKNYPDHAGITLAAGITLTSRIQSSEHLLMYVEYLYSLLVGFHHRSSFWIPISCASRCITLASRGMVVKWVRIKLKICFFERSRAVDSPRYSIFSITLKTLGDRADPSSRP